MAKGKNLDGKWRLLADVVKAHRLALLKRSKVEHSTPQENIQKITPSDR